MNNRELLELAAKAAGYKLSWAHDDSCCFIDGQDEPWNPLGDDGDALRLANIRHLCVCHTLGGIKGAHGTAMVGTSLWDNTGEGLLAVERYYGVHDIDYATRRAIVRAAAEIGRRMA